MVFQFMSKFLGEDVVAIYEVTEHARQPQAEKKSLSTRSGVLRGMDTNPLWLATQLNTCLWQPSIKLP